MKKVFGDGVVVPNHTDPLGESYSRIIQKLLNIIN